MVRPERLEPPKPQIRRAQDREMRISEIIDELYYAIG
jgi:hypothetical protein